MAHKSQSPEVAATWEPIDSLTPWAKNPRKNDGEPVDRVAKSIQRFGFSSPIVVRAQDRRIIAGHTRWKAAKALGMTQVPVRFLPLDEDQAAALALADNRLTEITPWDDEALADVMREIEAAGVDMDGLGWTSEELDALLEGPAPEMPEPSDDAPEVQDGPADSVVGQVYELGPHRLICGSNERADTSGVDALIGDPPFGISVVPRGGQIGGSVMAQNQTYKPVAGDGQPFDPGPWLGSAPVVALFGANYFSERLPGGQWHVWDKGRPPGTTFSDAELMWTNGSGVAVKMWRCVWNGMVREGESGPRFHPTQKPVKLMVEVVETLTKPGDVVCDPWGGSGTTLLACAKTGRVARLIELDPHYCDVIRRRWTAYADEAGVDAGPGALR